MSVVVKGMEMPNACWSCEGCDSCDGEAKTEYWCVFERNARDLDNVDIFKDKPDWCPLVELPEHHGDLIDRKDVLDACEFIGERPTVDNPYSEKYACRSEIIENIPAVIEQE